MFCLSSRGPLIEIALLALDEPRQLDRQHQLEAQAGMLEELVVEHRPEQGLHLLGRAVDQVRLVDAIDQHDDARVAERAQQPCSFIKQLVAVVGAVLVGQRLAGDLGGQ